MNDQKINSILNKTSVCSITHDDVATTYVAISQNLVISVDNNSKNSVIGYRVFDSIGAAQDDIDTRFGVNSYVITPNAEYDMAQLISSLRDEINALTEHHANVYMKLLNGISSISEDKHDTNSDSLDTLALKKFINETIEESDGSDAILVSVIYTMYKKWTTQYGFILSVSYDEFIKKLIDLGWDIKKNYIKSTGIEHILYGKLIEKSKEKTMRQMKLYIASHVAKARGESTSLSKFSNIIRKKSKITSSNDDIKNILIALKLYNGEGDIKNLKILDDAIEGNAERAQRYDEIRNIYRDPDMRVEDVAKAYGINTNEAYAVIKGKSCISKRPSYNWEEIQKYCDSHSNVTSSDLVKKYGMSFNTIYYAVKKGNLKIDIKQYKRERVNHE